MSCLDHKMNKELKKMSNLFAKALEKEKQKESSQLFVKVMQQVNEETNRENVTFEEFKDNPYQYDVLDFRSFKKKRQKENPQPKGRPKDPNYVSHKKAYEEYIRNKYSEYSDKIL